MNYELRPSGEGPAQYASSRLTVAGAGVSFGASRRMRRSDSIRDPRPSLPRKILQVHVPDTLGPIDGLAVNAVILQQILIQFIHSDLLNARPKKISIADR